jgi:hypothetical protein
MSPAPLHFGNSTAFSGSSGRVRKEQPPPQNTAHPDKRIVREARFTATGTEAGIKLV